MKKWITHLHFIKTRRKIVPDFLLRHSTIGSTHPQGILFILVLHGMRSIAEQTGKEVAHRKVCPSSHAYEMVGRLYEILHSSTHKGDHASSRKKEQIPPRGYFHDFPHLGL